MAGGRTSGKNINRSRRLRLLLDRFCWNTRRRDQ